MDTEDFRWHGYVSLKLEGRWFKATPAFNIEMCRRFGVPALEFDGTSDSLLHAYDARNQRFMEYVRDRGVHDDLPYEDAARDWRAAYPRLLAAVDAGEVGGRFEADRMRR